MFSYFSVPFFSRRDICIMWVYKGTTIISNICEHLFKKDNILAQSYAFFSFLPLLFSKKAILPRSIIIFNFRKLGLLSL